MGSRAILAASMLEVGPSQFFGLPGLRGGAILLEGQEDRENMEPLGT